MIYKIILNLSRSIINIYYLQNYSIFLQQYRLNCTLLVFYNPPMLRLLQQFIIISIFCLFLSHGQTFNDYKQQMEEIVLQIATNLEQYYSNWCIDGIATCETLTYNGCLGIKEKHCDLQYPKLTACLYPGSYISTASSVQFPPGMNYNNLIQQDIHFVCSSAKLEQTFQSIVRNRDKRFTGMYIGSYRGLFREFPGVFRGQGPLCDDYDPRHRPWYTIAASGAKNVMILLDISSSMLNKSQDAITAAITIVASLSISDNVAVITFQNSTTVVGNEKQILVRATNGNKKILIGAIKNINFTFDKQTNFLAAFQKGLELVNNTIAQGYSGCSMAQNVFLLITDGNPTVDNKTSPESLIQAINNFTRKKQSAIKRLVIFIYALGNINIEYLRNLSCQFNGIIITSSQTQELKTTSQAATQLIQFYKYLSVGIKFTEPIWTEPYHDYYTNIEMVTVSMPAYYTDKRTNLTTMFAVIGLDINMNYFTHFGYSFSDIITKLTGENACQKNIIDNCKLESLRSANFRCNIPNCKVTNWNETLCQSAPSTSSIYIFQNSTTDQSVCCGITVKQFIIILSTSFGSAVIIALVIWQRKRLWKKFCDRSYRSINRSEKSDRRRRNSSNKSHLENKKSYSNSINASVESNKMMKEPSI